MTLPNGFPISSRRCTRRNGYVRRVQTSMTSTLRLTSSAASAGIRSDFPSPERHSMTMFFPSTYPSSRRPCLKASTRVELDEGEEIARYPIRGTFFASWADAERQSPKSMRLRVRAVIFFFICFSLPRSTCHSTPDPRPFSLDHLVRSRQHVGRNREADLLCSLEIDHQLKLCRLLDGQIGGFCAFEDFVNVH